MDIKDIYMNGEINFAAVIALIDQTSDLKEKVKIIQTAINKASASKCEEMYAKGWDSRSEVANKLKKFSERKIKNALIEDDFAVIPLKDFIRWYASIVDEIKLINKRSKNECCRTTLEVIDLKIENALGNIRTDRRLLFKKETEDEMNMERITKEDTTNEKSPE